MATSAAAVHVWRCATKGVPRAHTGLALLALEHKQPPFFAIALSADHPEIRLSCCGHPDESLSLSGPCEADPEEHPIPEQFVSSFRGGKLVTESVAHSGA
eukprot:637769-Pelagomonas_calceolata.AAC.3